MLLQVAVWLVAHPRQFGNMWAGQRPGLQDISGGANFANKADNGIVVHRNWARLKELRERAAVAAGKKPPSEGKGRGKKGGHGTEDGDAGDEEIDPLEELRVEIYVEKVGGVALPVLRLWSECCSGGCRSARIQFIECSGCCVTTQ